MVFLECIRRHPAKRRSSDRWLAVLLICLGFQTLFGATDKEDPLVPDRPGFYCGSLSVPQGYVHLETGLALQWLRKGEFKADTLYFPVVVRVGVVDSLEFRVSTPSYLRVAGESPFGRTVEDGFGGAVVGLKWQFKEAPENGPGSSMGLLFSLNLPVGADFAKPDKAEPGFIWAADWSLPNGFGLATNLGVSAPYDSTLRERFADLFFAAALGRSVGPSTSLFIEVAGDKPPERNGNAEVFLDGGVTHLVNEDLQLDVSVIRGLNEDATDWAIGAGISLRFR